MKKTGISLMCMCALTAGTVSTANAWIYGTGSIDDYTVLNDHIVKPGEIDLAGDELVPYSTGEDFMREAAVITNDSLEAQDLTLRLNYDNTKPGYYEFSVDEGNTWSIVEEGRTELIVPNIAGGSSVLLRAITTHIRYNTPVYEGHFTFSGHMAAVVKDDDTVLFKGKMWQQNTSDVDGSGDITSDDGLLIADALNYCANLDFAGYDDWRLPSKDEMKEIVACIDSSPWNEYPPPPVDTTVGPLLDGQYCGVDGGNTQYVRPTIYQSIFDTMVAVYWGYRSEEDGGVDTRPWITNFIHGRTWITWDAPYYVRCVRDLD